MSLDQVGAVALGRVGVRFLRTHDFDFDVFAGGYLPLFNTDDPDRPLFGEGGLYTPSVQVGVGVGF